MKKIVILALAAVSLTGCGEHIKYVESHKAMTAEEQKCIREQALLIAPAPKGLKSLTLSGHDQDWDDAIKAAYNTALSSCTPPRLFEYSCTMDGCQPTGK